MKSGTNTNNSDNNLDIHQDQRRIRLSSDQPDQTTGIIIKIKGDGNCLFRAISEKCKTLEGVMPDFTKNHIELRKKVVAELRKKDPENMQVLKSILSAEKEISTEEIADEDVDEYINDMSQSAWGGYTEIFIITKLLEKRIIVYQKKAPPEEGYDRLDIPPGQDHNHWPILAELVHEAATIESGAESAHNHYNLAVDTQLATSILSYTNIDNMKDTKDIAKKYYTDSASPLELIIKYIHALSAYKERKSSDLSQAEVLEIKESLIKISWRAEEISWGLKFRYRGIICENDWNNLELLSGFLLPIDDQEKLKNILPDLLGDILKIESSIQAILKNPNGKNSKANCGSQISNGPVEFQSPKT